MAPSTKEPQLDRSGELAFTYFPDDYRWSHGLLIALNAAPWGGAEIGEVHRVGLRLQEQVGDDEAWFRAWCDEAATVAGRGRELAAAGRRRSAAAALFRAANYFHVGERFVQPKTAASDVAYKEGVTCFLEAAGRTRRPEIEPVEIPYEESTLPGLLVHAERRDTTPAPGMVYFDGFDITKEMQYFKGAAELAARGISCLVVDGPGNGESIRFRGLPLHHETERYAIAAFEWLAARPEVDEARIGVMGISLGGYYAPRAAAFEQRFACCVAGGAQWDYHARWSERLAQLDGGGRPSLSVPWQHLLWVLGVSSRAEALAALAGFRLDGVVQRIRCPVLVLHGEGDEQVPLHEAQRCYDAVGSAHKTLRVFTRAEGGYHHCQIDNVSIAVAEMADWLDDVLSPG